MSALHLIRRSLGNERGIAIIWTAIWITAFFALTAVAVDIGRVTFVATEVQNAAEVAATAAAQRLMGGGTTAQAQSDADTVIALNFVDRQVAASAPIVPGTENNTTGHFTPNAAPPNAAKATAQVTVNNLFTGALGFPSMTITKTAVAEFFTTSSETPTVPMALGDCDFTGHNCSNGDCPTVTQIPAGTDNAAWINPTNGASNQSGIDAFFPAPCGAGTSTMPVLDVNDASHNQVNANNGQITPLLNDLFCMWCTLGITSFTVPTVPCGGNFNGTKTIDGFATFTISSFNTANGGTLVCGQTGGGALKSVNISTVRDASAPGSPGGVAINGTGSVRLVPDL